MQNSQSWVGALQRAQHMPADIVEQMNRRAEAAREGTTSLTRAQISTALTGKGMLHTLAARLLHDTGRTISVTSVGGSFVTFQYVDKHHFDGKQVYAQFNISDWKTPTRVYTESGDVTGPLAPQRAIWTWTGISEVLETAYLASTLVNRTFQALTSTLHRNFQDSQYPFEVQTLPGLEIGRYDRVASNDRVVRELNSAWGDDWTVQDGDDILAYMRSLFGNESPKSYVRNARLPMYDFAGFCEQLVAKYWHRRTSCELNKYLLPVLGLQTQHFCARDDITATLTQEDLIGYVLYIFRDRLVRDSLPSNVTDMALLERLTQATARNQRYYIPPGWGSVHRRWSQPEWTLPTKIVPGVDWSIRMDALRSNAPPQHQALGLQPHDLGIFIESTACRHSLVKALFLAYEFRACPFYGGQHNWLDFVKYYDTYWIVEIMVREHEHMIREEKEKRRRRADNRPLQRDKKARTQ